MRSREASSLNEEEMMAVSVLPLRNLVAAGGPIVIALIGD